MGLRLSKEYGVNPSIDMCFVCGEEIDIILFGTSYKDENGKTAQAPTKICSGRLCKKCEEFIERGYVFFIVVKDGQSGKNPRRSGPIVQIKKEVAKEMFNADVQNINYLEESAYKQIFVENA